MRLHKIIFLSCVMLAAVLFANGMYVLDIFGDKPSRSREPVKISEPGTAHRESSMSGWQPVNMLVLGLDGEEVRTDVILLLNYNPELQKLNILSIARDTRVHTKGKYTKINALYSAGKENLLASEIKRLTGLQSHYYLTLNFKGFRKIVDVLGGIRFDVPFDMDYDDPGQDLHIHLDSGYQLLDGKKAEQLVRYRKGNSPEQGYIDGDIGRIRMQQEFLKALFKQKLNLKYASRAGDIFEILEDSVSTNAGFADITRYLGGILGLRQEDVKTFILPGDSALKSNAWYYIPDEEETERLIEGNFFK